MAVNNLTMTVRPRANTSRQCSAQSVQIHRIAVVSYDDPVYAGKAHWEEEIRGFSAWRRASLVTQVPVAC